MDKLNINNINILSNSGDAIQLIWLYLNQKQGCDKVIDIIKSEIKDIEGIDKKTLEDQNRLEEIYAYLKNTEAYKEQQNVPNGLVIKGKQDLAKYYLDRDFSCISFDILKELQELTEYKDTINIIQPSEKYYFKEFCQDNDCKIKFEDLDKKKNEEIKEEWERWLEEGQDENYPCWNNVWKIKGGEWAIKTLEERIDELADIGIGLLEFRDSYYLFIAGAGYNFFEAHWVPLFSKFFKWIKT